MVKFQFLAQFPVDHLAHPVVSSLLRFPCSFAAFSYVIDRFVSITTWPTSAVLLCLIYFCFEIGWSLRRCFVLLPEEIQFIIIIISIIIIIIIAASSFDDKDIAKYHLWPNSTSLKRRIWKYEYVVIKNMYISYIYLCNFIFGHRVVTILFFV